MKIVSEQFKTQAKELVRVQLAKFTFKDTNETIDGEYLVSGFLQEQSFANDVLVGNVIAKNLEFSVHNPNNIDYIDKEIVFYTGLYVNGEPSYVKHGSFIIDTAEKDEASDIVKVKAMDYIIKANRDFIDKLNWKNEKYTIGEFAQYVCNQCGLVLKTTSFPNSDYVLTEQPAFEAYQCRYVLGKIAEIAGCSVYLNSEDEVEIKLVNNNEVEDIIVDSISEMETTTANSTPYNIVTIALANGVEGENVTKRDEESISEYGERSLIITANEFAINENVRKDLIDAIFDNINGFNYTPIKITYNSYDWLDRGDKIRVYYDDNNFYETYLLNHTIEFPSSVKSVIENSSVSITNSKNQYVPPEVQQRTHTEIVVDKLNNEITFTIENQNNQISKITQTVNELNSKISDLADITISQESNSGKLEFDKINQSEPIRVVIKPIVESISGLFPSSGLYPTNKFVEGSEGLVPSKTLTPSSTLKPITGRKDQDIIYPKTRTLRFHNKTTGENFDLVLPDDILYYDSENFDEFILDYDSLSCVINKKVGLNEDGSVYVLDVPKTIEYEYPHLEITDGDYVVTLIGHENAYLFVRLMAQNIYTTQFATKAELNSEIRQTANEINLEVSQKVNENEIISSLNNSIVKGEGIIELKTNSFIVDTDNLDISKDGTINAKNGSFTGTVNSTEGNIGGWNMDETGLSNGNYYIKKNGYSNVYTIADIFICQLMILGTLPKPESGNDAFKHYDVNGDGQINIQDMVLMQSMILGKI